MTQFIWFPRMELFKYMRPLKHMHKNETDLQIKSWNMSSLILQQKHSNKGIITKGNQLVLDIN